MESDSLSSASTTERSSAELEDPLFDDAVLRHMDTEKCSFTEKGMSYPTPSPGLLARPLSRSDYDKGFLPLLSQLTTVGNYSRERFETQFDAMRDVPGIYHVIVIEDTSTGKLVASATLLVEHKFIHGAAIRGRIEDVVVDSKYRSLSLGSFLLELLTCFSEVLGCYKVTLDCKSGLVGFYERFSYKNEGQCFLTNRFRD